MSEFGSNVIILTSFGTATVSFLSEQGEGKLPFRVSSVFELRVGEAEVVTSIFGLIVFACNRT